MALLGAGAVPATAQKSADTLRIVMRDALTNIDPYYNNLRTGVVMHHQGWDALVYRNPDTFKLEPLLATDALARTLQLSQQAVVAVGNRGNRQLSCVGRQFSDTVAFAWPA